MNRFDMEKHMQKGDKVGIVCCSNGMSQTRAAADIAD